MPKILIVTVGGSPQPIITSVKTLKPDRVIFICSGGKLGSHSQVTANGKPCKIRKGREVVKEMENLPTCLNLSNFNQEDDLVLIEEPDDPSECYTLVSRTIRNLLKKHDPNDIMADYTGGTKTMSLSLGMSAMDYDIRLYLTTSIGRGNLIGVDRGESTELVSTSLIDIERKLEQFLPLFFQQYQYPAAITQLQNLLTSRQIPKDSKKRIRSLLDCCKAFDAWDKFQHIRAWDLLQSMMKSSAIRKSALFLKRVMSSRDEIDDDFATPGKMASHGYEIVEDLVLNAERRAARGRYDDAVARIYRALELLVQIRLLSAHGIKTGNVSMDDIPEAVRDQYENLFSQEEEIKLGLRNSYELLSSFSDDPLGQLYQKQAKKIIGILNIRNDSILAHGFTPVTDSKYREFSDVASPFIQTGIKRICEPDIEQPVQFPISPNLDT